MYQYAALQVDLGVDLDSRVAVVGLNGSGRFPCLSERCLEERRVTEYGTQACHSACNVLAGKSTLLKLMTGGLEPLDGMVKRHNHLKVTPLRIALSSPCARASSLSSVLLATLFANAFMVPTVNAPCFT